MRKPILTALLLIPLALFSTIAFTLRAPAAPPPKPPNNETVVLLHGIGLTSRSMRVIEKHLRAEGYAVINLSYPSTKTHLDQLATTWLPETLAQYNLSSTSQLHFVTHSMGGILVRNWLEKNPPPKNLGRIVMIAPPNHGSEVADKLRRNWIYRWWAGPNGQQLLTANNTVIARLPDTAPPNTGIIAGNSTLNPLFSKWIPGPDDGDVSIESTKLENMADFIILPHQHTLIIRRPATIQQIIHFLTTGTFSHPSP